MPLTNTTGLFPVLLWSYVTTMCCQVPPAPNGAVQVPICVLQPRALTRNVLVLVTTPMPQLNDALLVFATMAPELVPPSPLTKIQAEILACGSFGSVGPLIRSVVAVPSVGPIPRAMSHDAQVGAAPVKQVASGRERHAQPIVEHRTKRTAWQRDHEVAGAGYGEIPDLRLGRGRMPTEPAIVVAGRRTSCRCRKPAISIR